MKHFIISWLFLSLSCFADDYSDNFANSVFNLQWNSDINDAQFLFPTGNFRPLHSEDNDISFVVSDISMTWYGIPTQEIYFTYSPKLKLNHVRVFFKYQDLEKVKKKCVEVFGINYRAKEDTEKQTFSWKHNRDIRLSINTKSPTQWVYLYVK
ncbi:hypothetical protein [Cellvibrio sp.]|uniref:hypothetical protein n=1 Tax=Cellvibrio sp. TaxID=1965322 RepID=UPI003964845A